MIARSGDAQLRENFYLSTCPNVENIVRQVVVSKINQTFVTIPATVRMFFHDCFVTVCVQLHLFPCCVSLETNKQKEKERRKNRENFLLSSLEFIWGTDYLVWKQSGTYVWGKHSLKAPWWSPQFLIISIYCFGVFNLYHAK